jgi:hypothetical protein
VKRQIWLAHLGQILCPPPWRRRVNKSIPFSWMVGYVETEVCRYEAIGLQPGLGLRKMFLVIFGELLASDGQIVEQRLDVDRRAPLKRRPGQWNVLIEHVNFGRFHHTHRTSKKKKMLTGREQVFLDTTFPIGSNSNIQPRGSVAAVADWTVTCRTKIRSQ